jgi:hypothetical protein
MDHHPQLTLQRRRTSSGQSGHFGGFNVEVIVDGSDAPKGELASVDMESVGIFEAVIDMGASYNYSNSLSLVHGYRSFGTAIPVEMADGSHVEALGHGLVGVLPFLYVPALRQNLVSVSAMEDIGIAIQLRDGGSVQGQILGVNGLEEGPFYGSVYQKQHNQLLYVSFSVTPPTVPGGDIPSAQEYPLLFKADLTCRAYVTATNMELPDVSVSRFVVDSGATHSIVNTLQGVVLDHTLPQVIVVMADGTTLRSEGRGVFNFQFAVIHVPQFTHNLCSVAAMAREGYKLEFKNGAGQFMRGGVKVPQFTIQRAGNLYFTDITRVEPLQLTASQRTRRAEILALQAANPLTSDPSNRVPIASVGGKAPTCTNCMGCTHVTNSCWDQHPELKASFLARKSARQAAAAQGEPSPVRSTLARDPSLYHVALGTVQWLARTTHPELEYSASLLGSRRGPPTEMDVAEVINILRHCQQTARAFKRTSANGPVSIVEREAGAINEVSDMVLDLMTRMSIIEGARGIQGPAVVVTDHEAAAQRAYREQLGKYDTGTSSL